MAAEVLSRHGVQVDLYDAMPSVGRKFLMAGKSGLNLTHAEPLDVFLSRYGARRAQLEPMLTAFGPQALRDWAQGLGTETFVGSSGRVFPTAMKAAPLLRGWRHRLREAGVRFHMRHRWLGFADKGGLRFITTEGEVTRRADASLLALGGGSWPRLGSTGVWVPVLQQQGIAVLPLQASNCGFEIGWSEYLRTRFAGEPVKSVCLSCTDVAGERHQQQGDFVISEYGIEGSPVYALAAMLRELITRDGHAVLHVDLLPDMRVERVADKLMQARGKRSLSAHLRRQLGITGVKSALLHEVLAASCLAEPQQLATAIKALPLTCLRPRPIDEAISTAGGVAFEALDDKLMLNSLPGVFCAGEMLDWDAPTGGYLLTACFASGYAAGHGLLDWLSGRAKTQ
jgi:hypothetical protein